MNRREMDVDSDRERKRVIEMALCVELEIPNGEKNGSHKIRYV